jgi:hypothetical protein
MRTWRQLVDERSWIALLPFWLLVAPPVLVILSTLMDGTMRRDRNRADYDRDRRPVA